MNTTTTEPHVCDFSYLEQFAQGNQGFQQEMLKIYLEEINIALIQLEHAIEQGNFENIEHTAHHMRSTLPFSGIDKLIGPDVERIELLGKKHAALDTIRTLFLEAKRVCVQANEEIKPLIRG